MGGQLIEQLLEMAPVERRVLTAASSKVGEESEPPGEAPLIRVQGFISRPEVQKLNRNNIYFFVNRRLVRDRLILHAITEAYRNILPSAVFPVVLIFLEIPPSEVDVNVHPSKTEVRFRHGSFVHDLVRDSIRQTLLTTRPVAAFPISRSAAPAGLAVEAADVADALAEEPPLMRGAMTPPPPGPPVGSRDESRIPPFSGANGASFTALAPGYNTRALSTGCAVGRALHRAGGDGSDSGTNSA